MNDDARLLRGLQELEDPQFLAESYKLFLGRSVDPDGFQHYMSRLSSGSTRMEIIKELRASPEGQAYERGKPPGDAGAAPEQVAALAPILSVQELVLLDDGPFVRAAFASIVGRAPESQVERHYVKRLRLGMPKVKLIADLRTGREGQRFDSQLAGLDDAVRQVKSGLFPVAANLEELVRLWDEDFVDCAYKTLLGRRPDPAGLGHYLNLVRSGESKTSVLWRLCESGEGAKRRAELPGLRSAIQWYRRVNGPLTGWFWRLFREADRNSGLHRRVRRLENEVFRLDRGQSHFLTDSDLSVEELEEVLVKVDQWVCRDFPE